MAATITNPAPAKRFNKLFRRKQPPHDTITSQFFDPKIDSVTPNAVAVSGYRSPTSIGEALAQSQSLPKPFSQLDDVHTIPPLQRFPSSQYCLEVKKSSSPQKPQSRKTGNATIITETSDLMPAFESDAFAVHAPATREPVFDDRFPPKKLTEPSQAQVEAYREYKEKARQVRARNNSQGVRVPSEIVSYDYANNPARTSVEIEGKELEAEPPVSPSTPAGSLPESPPLPKLEQKRALIGSVAPPKVSTTKRGVTSNSSNVSIHRKPISGVWERTNAAQRHKYFPSGDTVTGAAKSVASSEGSGTTPTSSPTKIRVTLKPKTNLIDAASQQKESKWSIYNCPMQLSSSSEGSPSQSPTKMMADFAFPNPIPRVGGTRTKIGGYKSSDEEDTDEGVDDNSCATSASTQSQQSSPVRSRGVEKDEKQEPTTTAAKDPKSSKQKRKFTDRWGRLRSSNHNSQQHAQKTTLASPVSTSSSHKAEYISPFTTLHTLPPHRPHRSHHRSFANHRIPTTLVPRSPTTRLARPSSPRTAHNNGLSQLSTFFSHLLKFALAIWLFFACYYLFVAIVQAVHVLSTPIWVLGQLGRLIVRGLVRMMDAVAWIWHVWGVEVEVKGGKAWRRWGW